MLDITPVGQDRLFIPVNPIQHREISAMMQRSEPRRIEPLAPARPTSHQQDETPTERFYLLSAETRRSLFELEHPVNGQDRTD